MTAAIPARRVDTSAPAETSLYERKPATRSFASRRGEPKLSPEQVARQSRAVSGALRVFASPAAAMAFLNAEHPDLGRPLDVAVASDSGLAAVEAAMASRHPATG